MANLFWKDLIMMCGNYCQSLYSRRTSECVSERASLKCKRHIISVPLTRWVGFNPLRACTARVTVVCLSVPANLQPQATRWPSSDIYQWPQCYIRGHCFKLGIFPKATSLKNYGVKHERKANMQMSLSSPPSAFAHFQDQRSTITT